jgi:hypothetical protein
MVVDLLSKLVDADVRIKRIAPGPPRDQRIATITNRIQSPSNTPGILLDYSIAINTISTFTYSITCDNIYYLLLLTSLSETYWIIIIPITSLHLHHHLLHQCQHLQPSFTTFIAR